MGVTIVRSFCNKAFVKDDFPTFGIPTIIVLISLLSVNDLNYHCPNFFIISSNKSPVNLPFKAEIGIGTFNPNS